MAAIPVNNPIINGYRFSWASIVLSVAGSDQPGVKSISYKNAIARSEARGSGRQRLGMTAGNYTPEASFAMLLEEWENFKSTLDQSGPWMDQPFDITVSFTEGSNLRVDVITGCRVKSEAKDYSNGTDALEVKVELDVSGTITSNGLNNPPFTGASV